jgi:hypothetical protein
VKDRQGIITIVVLCIAAFLGVLFFSLLLQDETVQHKLNEAKYNVNANLAIAKERVTTRLTQIGLIESNTVAATLEPITSVAYPTSVPTPFIVPRIDIGWGYKPATTASIMLEAVNFPDTIQFNSAHNYGTTSDASPISYGSITLEDITWDDVPIGSLDGNSVCGPNTQLTWSNGYTYCPGHRAYDGYCPNNGPTQQIKSPTHCVMLNWLWDEPGVGWAPVFACQVNSSEIPASVIPAVGIPEGITKVVMIVGHLVYKKDFKYPKPGTVMAPGQLIGELKDPTDLRENAAGERVYGSTGLTTGPHAHLIVRIQGKDGKFYRINPVAYGGAQPTSVSNCP